MIEMSNSNMFDSSQVQQQQPTMFDSQVEIQQSNMFDPQVQQQSQNLQEILAHMTSSKSNIEMRNENEEDSSGNEKLEVTVEVEASPSTDDQQSQKQSKRKGYHRHTQHQIEKMEEFYQKCNTHPDVEERITIATSIGLTPMQVKFWFQNKHTQMTAKQEREENDWLKAENERIVAESEKYKEELSKASCAECGGPASNNVSEMSFEEQRLRIENGRLKDEIARLSARLKNNVVVNSNNRAQSSNEAYSGGVGGSDVVRSFPPPTHEDKHKIAELAVAAMEELTELVKPESPFWIPSYSSEFLNVDEYMKAFPMGIGPKMLGFRTEASRESMVVIMNHMKLIEILMDVNQWTAMFSGIVVRGRTLEVLSSGLEGSYNRYLQVMSAEFQIPSPLVPTRENYFVRYCKKQKEGYWVVVDVSLDHLQPSSNIRSRRRPSGCIIQELPDGYSKVTWVEHVDVDDRDVVMLNPYNFLEKSCLAFGAKRWLAILERQCKRLASAMSINIPVRNLDGITSLGGGKSLLRLAERMMTYFCTAVGASKEHVWKPIDLADNADDIKVTIRASNDEPGRPCGVVLSVATSLCLSISPKRVFNYLRDNSTRSQWDILSIGGTVEEVAHIATNQDPGHYVSLLRVNNENANVGNMFMLQESCIDITGSYVVYSPIDVVVTNLVLSGGDPSYITLLPSGFAILPDGNGQCGLTIPNAIRSGGCMLTVAFQILVDANPTTTVSPALVRTATGFIKQSIRRIKAVLS